MHNTQHLKRFFPIYVVLALLIILTLSYYDTPIVGYDTAGNGQVNLRLRASTCGDEICGYQESDRCCIDCGCDVGYTCVDNSCSYGSRSGFSSPLFKIDPSTDKLTLTLGVEKELYYYVENIDLVNVRVALSVVKGVDYITLDETDFRLEPGVREGFTLTIADTLAVGSYSFSIMGVSGQTIEYAHLDIDVVEPTVDAKKPTLILSKTHFNLIWVVVPLTIAILLYLYFVRYKRKSFKRYNLLKM
ncbi:hypothetical protein HOD83_03570 [Candidatus Woesearchaeota archaeon]|nr:hypothetical protein [Candidatus Woesearchaeota archaeon]MBT4248634.1 hypothetical protein [Candidatus Woesearchaeota archaeon]